MPNTDNLIQRLIKQATSQGRHLRPLITGPRVEPVLSFGEGVSGGESLQHYLGLSNAAWTNLDYQTEVPLSRMYIRGTRVIQTREENDDMTKPVFMTVKDMRAALSLAKQNTYATALIRSSHRAPLGKNFRASWPTNAAKLIQPNIKRNLAQYFTTNFDELLAENFAASLAAFRFVVREKRDVNRVLDAFDTSGIDLVLPVDFIDRHPFLSRDMFVRYREHEEFMITPLNAVKCPHCGEFRLESERHEALPVYRSLRPPQIESWCKPCVDNEAFYCDISGRYYAGDYFSSGYTSGEDTICVEWATQEGWEFDGDYWYEYSLDSDDDDDDDGDRDTAIPEYHSARRPVFHPPSVLQSPKQRTYGVELEVEFLSSQDRENFFNTYFEHTGLSRDGMFSMELDGSLDGDLGAEIISAPIPLETYYDLNSPWRKMCRQLFEHNARGWPVRNEYGMHVNVDIRPIGMELLSAFDDDSQLQEDAASFVAFLLNNKELTAKLAGRNAAYSSSPMRKAAHMGEARQYLNNGKYNPAILKSEFLMEVRIFGSNIRHEGILRNVEYVDSGLEFVRQRRNALFGNLSFSEYRNWLRQPHHLDRWPTINAYLEPKITPDNQDIKRAVA